MDKQEFPKWLYGPNGQARIVNDPDEAKELKGWTESPVQVKPKAKE